VVSSLGEVTKGAGGRSVAPHFVQKMSPVCARSTTLCANHVLSGAAHLMDTHPRIG
jgi:hypothetical protein